MSLAGPIGPKDVRIRYLVEEYVDGGSLRQVLKGNWRPDLPTVAGWAVGILRALAAAHEKGLVHRDLKPENVLVDSQGNAEDRRFRPRPLDLPADGRPVAARTRRGTAPRR